MFIHQVEPRGAVGKRSRNARRDADAEGCVPRLLGLHPGLPMRASRRPEGVFHMGVSLLLSERKGEVRTPSLLPLFLWYLWLEITLKPKWRILGWRVLPPFSVSL